MSKVCRIDIDIFMIMNSSLTPVHNLFGPLENLLMAVKKNATPC